MDVEIGFFGLVSKVLMTLFYIFFKTCRIDHSFDVEFK